MPTSSQALILIHTKSGKWSSLYKKPVMINYAPFPLSIITLSGVGSCKMKSTSLPGFMVTNEDDTLLQSKSSMPSFMISSDDVSLKDYRGTLSYENSSKCFQWKLIPVTPDDISGTAKGRGRKSSAGFHTSPSSSSDEDEAEDEDEDDDADDYDDDDDDDTLVHASNFDDDISVDGSYNPHTNDSYMRLLNLGFSTSSFPEIQRLNSSFADFQKPGSHERRRFLISNRRGYNSQIVFASTSSRRSKRLPFLSNESKGYHVSQKSDPGLLKQDITATRRRFSTDCPLPPIGNKLAHRTYRKIASTVKERLGLLSRFHTKKLPETDPSSTNTKTWKKNTPLNLPHVRMRSQLPPPSPETLCFFLMNNVSFSHKEIKNIIESQSNTPIKSLRFDPVFVHLGIENTNDVCLWVFKLEKTSMCMRLLAQGLEFDSIHIRVRRYDDVLRDEHSAYVLYRSVMEDIERRKLDVKRRPSKLNQNKNQQRHEANRHIAFTGVV